MREVHYNGYGDDEDEWVGIGRLRSKLFKVGACMGTLRRASWAWLARRLVGSFALQLVECQLRAEGRVGAVVLCRRGLVPAEWFGGVVEAQGMLR